MNKWKWLLRGASLLIVVGCFVPAVLVSCNSGMNDLIGLDVSQGVSLLDIADAANQPLLYFIPLLSIAAIVLSFMQKEYGNQAMNYLWGQLAIIVLQVLIMILTLFGIRSDVQAYTFGAFEVTPTIGFYVIVASGFLYLVSWYFQKALINIPPLAHQPPDAKQVHQPVDNHQNALPPLPAFQPAEEDIFRPSSQPVLMVVSGSLPAGQIPIPNDNFTVGRAPTNQLRLEEATVSRAHAVFRYSQDAWYLQDQNSSAGTYVNGLRIDAVRLNHGDEITIGPYKFQFQIN
ncbi:MAG: FHA domain-containing protein [Chloroflexi bacterium]|jgi:hypothetical protein|nr:FHA domain-containing protein [Chloroflexota bacterium]